MDVPQVQVFGVDVDALPEGWTPLEVCVLIKAIDDDGISRLASRYSSSLNGWEALGMLELERASQRRILVDAFNGESE